MKTNRLLLLLMGLLHLGLAFPHGADHTENCTIKERVSFIIKGGTSEGNFKPEVIPLNNTRLELIGEPRGNVVEEVRNGVKYSIIKTSVKVMIPPPPTTSSLATSSPIISSPIITTEETTTKRTTTEGTTTKGTTTERTTTEGTTTEVATTTSSSVPGEFITKDGFGSYKYHGREPIENMMEICANEDAVVAYPLYLEEVDAMCEEFNTSTTWLAVGVKWIENDTYYNFKNDIAYFNENLWDDGEPSNDTGNCAALNLKRKRMKRIDCSEELPFLCKKDVKYTEENGNCNTMKALVVCVDFQDMERCHVDGFERGYGFYSYQGPVDISEMEKKCKAINRTVAVPQSPEEVDVMLSHILDNDLYLSVGIKKVISDGVKQYVRVNVFKMVNENVLENVFVNISSDLMEGGKITGSGHCIVLRNSTKLLIGNRCENVKYPFLCKRDLIPPPSVFLSDKNITYQYQPWYKKTSEVTASCKAQGFTSVAFPTEENYVNEAEEIAALIPDDEPYIATGIQRTNSSEGTYGELHLKRSFNYNSSDFWEDGEPKYVGDCIKFSKKSHKFLDFNCKEPLPYICVKNG